MLLFEPITIKQMRLPNRVVRSATYDGMADSHGAVTEQSLDLFSRLSQGGVGLIISGVDHVCHNGWMQVHQTSLADDGKIPGLKKLTGVVHRHEAKVAAQLFHAGREAHALRHSGVTPLAPSYLAEDPYFKKEHRAMKEPEIWEIIQAFGEAAGRAREAGFDAVQVHGAHGYLFSQFLSPYTNRRGDHWGGSLDNRLRIHLEVLKAIRAKVGPDYPVLIKLGVQDGFKEGLRFQEGLQAAVELSRAGYDCLEISLGVRGAGKTAVEFHPNIKTREQEAYYRQWARLVKKAVSAPVNMVGGLRSPDLMEEALAAGDCDLVSLSRPLIRENDLVGRWLAGKLDKPKCVSCNGCLKFAVRGEPMRCALEDKELMR